MSLERIILIAFTVVSYSLAIVTNINEPLSLAHPGFWLMMIGVFFIGESLGAVLQYREIKPMLVIFLGLPFLVTGILWLGQFSLTQNRLHFIIGAILGVIGFKLLFSNLNGTR